MKLKYIKIENRMHKPITPAMTIPAIAPADSESLPLDSKRPEELLEESDVDDETIFELDDEIVLEPEEVNNEEEEEEEEE